MAETAFVIDEERQATAHRRLNVGCGMHPLFYWTNLDAEVSVAPDVVASVPPIPYPNESLDEISAVHFLEHLTPEQADEFLEECKRCLVSEGRLAIVVPDTKEVVKRYLRAGTDEVEYPYGVFRRVADLDEVCRMFFYSTVQESQHKWSYDIDTLGRLIRRHGFTLVRQLDRWRDPRISVGAWYQCGWEAVK